MTPPKSPDVSLPSSPRIACYGTAFLADSPIDTTALKRGIPLDVPLLINCGRFLTGGSVVTESAPSAYVKRLAGTDLHSPKATVFYECSTELRGQLAALTDDRAAELAQNWYGIKGSAKIERDGRTQRRLAILNNLAVLAKRATVGTMKLMLRVEYREQR